MDYTGCFASSYRQARHNFLTSCSEQANYTNSWQHPLRGIEGEKLYIDLAWYGELTAPKVLVLISGIHGVEGFCGSGIQVASIKAGWHRQASADVAIVLIHGLNPWGMSHLRRVNEAGVDLNRNFWDFSQPLPINPLYDAIADIIVPLEWTEESQLQTFEQLFEYLSGAESRLQHLAQGQYSHWYAPFYGGEVPTWSNRVFNQIVEQFLLQRQVVGLLDYHTGLGQYATGQLITTGNTDPQVQGKPLSKSAKSADEKLNLDDCQSLDTRDSNTQDLATPNLALQTWGSKVIRAGSPNSVAPYQPQGTLIASLKAKLSRASQSVSPPAYIAAVYEFGTIMETDVFNALRADHWLHLHGDLQSKQAQSIRQNMLTAFYCDRPEWQTSVCNLAFSAQAELLTTFKSI